MPTEGGRGERSSGTLVRNARIGSKAAGIVTRGVGRRLYAGVRRDPDLQERAAVRSATEVAEALGDLRGGMAKLGQLLSYVDHRVPPALRAALADLCEDAPVMAPELVAEVVEEELGRPPDAVFETWDPTPIAAASIGQVHRAILPTGAAVAVKVQYPDVRASLTADMKSMGVLVRMLRPVFGSLDPRPIVNELAARLPEELDYRIEARHQRQLARIWEGHPHIQVPEVFTDLCTERLLVTALVDGASFRDACLWPSAERDLAGETIYRWMEENLYRHHLVHGDMHPGNLRFHGGGRVTFLDFGLVDHVDDADVARIASAPRARVDAVTPEEFARIVVDGGYLPEGHGLDEASIEGYFGPFIDLETTPGLSCVTPERAAALIDGYFGAQEQFADVIEQMTVPPRDVILSRANIGTLGVLSQLGATADWRRIAAASWPWESDEPPTSPLGEAHQMWLAEKTDRTTADGTTAGGPGPTRIDRGADDADRDEPGSR